mmetsp:Transcript_43078/g.103890  ORF Transcript_43078/g.103890 Transcript_43078/m.103890 type:complete len:338 (-) Transcript_43078:183-1196(-)
MHPSPWGCLGSRAPRLRSSSSNRAPLSTLLARALRARRQTGFRSITSHASIMYFSNSSCPTCPFWSRSKNCQNLSRRDGRSSTMALTACSMASAAATKRSSLYLMLPPCSGSASTTQACTERSNIVCPKENAPVPVLCLMATSCALPIFSRQAMTRFSRATCPSVDGSQSLTISQPTITDSTGHIKYCRISSSHSTLDSAPSLSKSHSVNRSLASRRILVRGLAKAKVSPLCLFRNSPCCEGGRCHSAAMRCRWEAASSRWGICSSATLAKNRRIARMTPEPRKLWQYACSSPVGWDLAIPFPCFFMLCRAAVVGCCNHKVHSISTKPWSGPSENLE